MKYKRKFTIKLLEESDSANIYTICFDGERSEFEKFIIEFNEEKKLIKDLERISYYIEKIGAKGALERYFRPESKMADSVSAIPIEFSYLRLYCLRISDEILILGNGGFKPPKQHDYNSDPHLNSCVEILASLDFFIKKRLAQGKITIRGKTITGDLTFYI